VLRSRIWGQSVIKRLLASAAIVALVSGGTAYAGDAGKPASGASQYDWTGFYAGVAAGAAWGQYDAQTSTVGDGYMNAAQAAAVTAAGAQTVKPTGFVAGVEGGYNWQIGNLLLGLEADLQGVQLNDATDSGAVLYPGTRLRRFTVTSYENIDWLFTARPRIGFVAPNHWLFYATGGLALTQLESDFSFVDNNGALESGRLDAVRVGYAFGGGVEAPLTKRLSLKVDYLYVDFANAAASATANNLTPTFPGQVFSYSSDLKANIVRAGLNYRFGGPDGTLGSDLILPFKPPTWKIPPVLTNGWELETGARFWFSSGTVGAPQPLLDTPPTTLASRLVYSGLEGVSGEAFARVDHASRFFIKGYLGAGAILSGSLNDEDFPAGPTYSNTLSSASGHIGYATVDVGYSIWRTPGAKVGPFVGYNYYTQAINTYGCSQVAGSNVCSPALDPTLLGLTENDTLNSLRVGLSSEVMLADRLKFTADAAYVPLVGFSGLDDHLLRQLLGPEAANSGGGVMLEATLDYSVTKSLSVGVGGRYWAWNMNTGTLGFDFLGPRIPPSTETARFTTERYGMFVQSSYRWGDPASSDDPPMLTKAPVIASRPMNWTGFYIGGHLGGGFSDAQWSDPFGSSTPGRFGFSNIAGFGDSTHATGPLAGGQIGADWQTGHLVLGVQADASAAQMHGENTCFSGIGGIDCQHSVNSLGTIAGRLGYAWDRSLVYAKAGGAWTNTTYSLFGDTNALTLGAGNTTLDTWGWTVGGGIEYAVTNHWIAFAEYDHIGLSATTVPFPTVATINTQTIRVSQTVDFFKLGVNYKFDLASLAAIAAKH
jgi:opacity protein-like surface antigen